MIFCFPGSVPFAVADSVVLVPTTCVSVPTAMVLVMVLAAAVKAAVAKEVTEEAAMAVDMAPVAASAEATASELLKRMWADRYDFALPLVTIFPDY